MRVLTVICSSKGKAMLFGVSGDVVNGLRLGLE